LLRYEKFVFKAQIFKYDLKLQIAKEFDNKL